MRSAHLNSTLQSESEIKSLRSGPSHRRSSPHRRREPLRARKHQSFVRFLPSKHHLDTAVTLRSAVTALQSQKNYLDQGCKHEAAITVRSARLISTLQWRTRPGSNPRSGPSHRQGSPHQRRGAPFVRENTGFGAIPNVQTSPWRSNSTAICNHRCLANREK